MSAARRLEQVLKFELDEILPFDIEDAVFDFVEMNRSGDEITVVSAAVLLEHLEKLVSGLDAHGISPREIGVATFSYMLGLAAEQAQGER